MRWLRIMWAKLWRGREGCQIVLLRWEVCGRGGGRGLMVGVVTLLMNGLSVLVAYLERILGDTHRKTSCSGQNAASASRRRKDGLSMSSRMLRRGRRIRRKSIMMYCVIVI